MKLLFFQQHFAFYLSRWLVVVLLLLADVYIALHVPLQDLYANLYYSATKIHKHAVEKKKDGNGGFLAVNMCLAKPFSE